MTNLAQHVDARGRYRPETSGAPIKLLRVVKPRFEVLAPARVVKLPDGGYMVQLEAGWRGDLHANPLEDNRLKDGGI